MTRFLGGQRGPHLIHDILHEQIASATFGILIPLALLKKN